MNDKHWGELTDGLVPIKMYSIIIVVEMCEKGVPRKFYYCIKSQNL